MQKTTKIALMVAGVIVASVLPASAQAPPPTKNFFADVNFGIQPSAQTFTLEAFPVVYGETAIVRATQGIDGAGLIDVTAGYRVWRNFSVALGLTTTLTSSGDASVTGGIPHPAFYDRRVESTVEVTGLEHRERSLHLSFMWTTPVTDKIDASVFGGPSYIKVFQDLLTTVTVAPGTQTFTPVAAKQTATTPGVHFGGDVTFLIRPHVGIGGMLKFVKATGDSPAVNENLLVAGFQYGGGVRIRF